MNIDILAILCHITLELEKEKCSRGISLSSLEHSSFKYKSRFANEVVVVDFIQAPLPYKGFLFFCTVSSAGAAAHGCHNHTLSP